jgi:anti-sigma B factor antagonist
MSPASRITQSNGADAPETRRRQGTGRFQVDVQPEPYGARVCPVGEIDLATVAHVRRNIEESVAAGCRRVVLDLRGVTFMDSTALHLALDADAAASADGWELLIIAGSGRVQRVFEITGLRERLPFVEAPRDPRPTATRQNSDG